ncbi:hypothetical protein HY492_02410 [Candidatus Woesearchaeota archaeon]|nr:hypothetical protein [Candidatus Woesearchaeota archaeon]
MNVTIKAGKRAKVTQHAGVFLNTNQKGAFAIFGNNQSRYEGVFFKADKVYKIIESIDIGPITSATNALSSVTRNNVTTWMPDAYDALVLEQASASQLTLALDAKALFDNRQWGRSFVMGVEHRCLVFTCLKRNDARDGMKDASEYTLYLAAFGEGLGYQPIEQWKEQFYAADNARKSWPWSRGVFIAAKLRCKDVVFAFSTNKMAAIETAINVYAQRKKLRKAKEDRIAKLIKGQSVEAACAIAAIDALRTPEGFRAGLPWFVDVWSRDELVAAKALMLNKEFATVKTLLWKHLEALDGATLASKPQGIPAADAPGWLFLRIAEFLALLEQERKLKTYVSSKDLAFVEQKLRTCINLLFKDHAKNGLILTNANETWMDSISRDGARIEIQAMTLSMLKLLGALQGKPDFRELQLKLATRRDFLKHTTLIDGKEDPILRPNLFLAVYFYPALLTKQEWTNVIDKALDALWLDWGGLATIDTKHPAYQPTSTGENALSYHNGDSWFWLNNLAAIAMYMIDKKRYKKQIDAVRTASLTELFELGVSGHAGELSSAAHRSSVGCNAQLWSAATLLELIRVG